ncbi:MAG: hypothetical protein A3K19_28465 [Lentisphaerae bacterium RIFOXYB12_FULL_65_16]|nr:MAG: hypothetical protein A3K18_19715 [Lentisphaerae bacterium RIFOXYA12_64_32]OGV85520.1 MAG: hypothetical protein A3K19_28465 [Lentisphaerae bacterium RIFOXYB12_FULL_65_16]
MSPVCRITLLIALGRLAVAPGAPDRREGKRTVTVTPLFGYERDADKRWLRVLKFIRVPLPAPRPAPVPGADATAGM